MRYQTAAQRDVRRPKRCHFDIFKRVLVDCDGVDVGDLDSAVAEARNAIDELRVDAAQDAGRGAMSRAELRSELYLLVRVDGEGVVCMIPLRVGPNGQ